VGGRKMEFGALVLSKVRSLQKELVAIDGKYEFITTLKIGKFIFLRPDNGKMIIEINGNLVEEKPENILPFNRESVEYFTNLIRESYEKWKEVKQRQIDELMSKYQEHQGKVNELNSYIARLETKNQVAYSENRAKEIRGVSKALRRKQRQLNGMEVKIKGIQSKIQLIEKIKEVSMNSVEEIVKSHLKE
jgi:hypothetical protein